MEKDNSYNFKNIIKPSLIYGIIFGSIILVINILDYFIGFHEQNHFINNINYLLRIIGLLICLLIFRKKAGGYLSFEKLFTFSLLAFVFAMSLYDTFSCIMFNIYPDLLYNKVENIRESLLSAGVSSEITEKSIDSTFWVKNPYYVIISFLIWVLFVGPIVSSIFALMLQKKPVVTENGDTTENEDFNEDDLADIQQLEDYL